MDTPTTPLPTTTSVSSEPELKIKRGRGRPRKIRTEPEIKKPRPRLIRKSTFPSQPARTTFPIPPMKMMDKKPGEKMFIEYWNSLNTLLNDNQKDLCKVWVYRNWPVVDPILVDPTRKKHLEIFFGREPIEGDRETSLPAMPCPFTLEGYEEEIIHRYGAGRYKFILGEKGVPGEICIAFLDFSSRFRDNPPRLDKREVMVGLPANAIYVNWMHQQNQYFPGEVGYKPTEDEQETEDMKVVGMQEKLVENVIEANRRMGEMEGERRARTETKNKSISTGSNDTVGKVLDAALKLVDTAGPKQEKDPIATVTALIAALKPNSDGITELIKENKELRKDMFTQYQNFTTQLINMKFGNDEEGQPTANGSGGNGSGQQKSFLTELQELEEKAKILGYSKRGRKNSGDDDDEDNDDDSKNSRKQNQLEQYLAIATLAAPIIGQFLNIAGSIIAGKMGLNIPAPQPQPRPNNVTVMPGGSPGNAAGQPPASAGEIESTQSIQFLQMITQPFIAHFFGDNTNGVTFAHFLLTEGMGAAITVGGRQIYEQLKESGKESLIAMLSAYPPIWEKIKHTPAKLNTFMEEFLHYDEIVAREEAEDEADDRGVESGDKVN